VLRTWQLPESFTRLRQALEVRHGRASGERHYVRVVQLLGEHPPERVLHKPSRPACVVTNCTPNASVLRPGV
jgi:hypothetical protein